MSVAIIGGGVIGQLMAQLARLAGATSTILVTRQATRRALAERIGATATVNPSEVDVVRSILGPAGLSTDGVDVAIECVGAAETFEQCLAITRRGGTVLVVGVAPEDDFARIRPFDVFARELRIVGSYLNPQTHGRAVELAASGRIDLASLISHRVGLEEVPSILARGPEPGELKVIVSP
jgi:threonine dehydrogenase-like Zn-dependent dehydrogenase